MSLQGKVAIVTGASRGIGAATARLLAARGAKVIVNYVRNAEAAAGVVGEIKALGGEALAVQANVLLPDEIQRLVETTRSAFGRIDILVNNAGASFSQKPFAAMSWDEFATDVQDELKIAFLLTKAVLPVMMEQHYGRLIYVASGSARTPVPGMLSHGTAKAALVTFAQYIAQEAGANGITANIVSPGLTETDATASVPAQAREAISRMTPLRRLASPADIAGAIAFFASDDSGFMTGIYAPVDGGRTM
ncbi:MAG: short-chain dehydrogenase [Firmicutes bacterium]|nr:short-chain dehydrogenase [Bacillota bacterium]